MTRQFDYTTHLGSFLPALSGIEAQLAKGRIETSLLKLVKIRASQLNGCTHCLRMHLKEAARTGEPQERLGLVSAFREAEEFSAREKAALAWAERLTCISSGPPNESEAAELLAHFDESEIAELTLAIAMINLWNRVAVGLGAPDTPRSKVASAKKLAQAQHAARSDAS